MRQLMPPYQRWRGFFLLIVCVSILVWGIESWRRSTPTTVDEANGTAAVGDTTSDFQAVHGESISGSTSRREDGKTDDKTSEISASVVETASGHALSTPSLPPIAESIPDLQTIRAEVAHDPHTTPRAVLLFSVAIGRRLNADMDSETKATELFSELEDCVLNPKQKGSATIQALCLLNAHRLARRYPALLPREDRLAQRSDPEAVRRAHALY